MKLSDKKLNPSNNNNEELNSYTNAGAVGMEDEGGGVLSIPVNHTNFNVWDYEDILNVLGFGKAHWILLFISGLITITSMASQISVGIIAISSQCEFQMTVIEKGIMMGTCVLGIGISTFIWGYISDVWGRRTVLVWTMFVTSLLQFITMFVTNIWLYNVINFIMGISLGGASGSLYPYLSELNTSKYRNIVINYSTMSVSITQIYVPAICWLILSSDWSWVITDTFTFKPWRLIILFNFLPGLIGTLMLLPFPESPKLLISQEKSTEALEAINWVAKFNTGHSIETLLNTPIIYLKPDELTLDTKLASDAKGCGIICNIWKSTVPLFHKPHGLNFVIAIAVMAGLFFSNSGLEIWYPEIVNRSADDFSNNSTICTKIEDSFEAAKENAADSDNLFCDNRISTKTYIDNMIVGVAAFIGFAIQGLLLNPLGRKNVMLAACAIGALSGFSLYIVTNTTGILILFCLYIVLPGLAISIMCGAIVDLVPTHLRGKAISLGLTLGRIGVIGATNVIAVMLEPYCGGAFAIVTCSLFACGVLAYFLPI